LNPSEMSNSIVTQIMELVAEARLSQLRGKLDDGLALLMQAEPLQGSIGYDKPPYWLVPVEQTEASLLDLRSVWLWLTQCVMVKKA
jgi:hypothetical protein